MVLNFQMLNERNGRSTAVNAIEIYRRIAINTYREGAAADDGKFSSIFDCRLDKSI